MIRASTTSWGYQVVSANKLNFYHISLANVSISQILKVAPKAREVSLEKDGTITISVEKTRDMSEILLEIIPFLNRRLKEELYSTRYFYKMKDKTRKILGNWALAFEGCLALLLVNDKTVKKYIDDTWEFVNSTAGGLYLSPFTLLFYKDYPRVIQPVKYMNKEARQAMEKRASFIVRKIIKRIEESQKGYEGLALISLVENATGLKSSEISEIVYGKSFGIKTPKFSPLFNL